MSFSWGNPSGQSTSYVSPAEIKKPLFSGKPPSSSAPKAYAVGSVSGAQTVALPAANPFNATLAHTLAERQKRYNKESGTPASPADIPPVSKVGQANLAQFISGGKLRHTRSNTRRNMRRHRRRYTRRHKRGCKHNKRRSRR
jgi:hypothetical protein